MPDAEVGGPLSAISLAESDWDQPTRQSGPPSVGRAGNAEGDGFAPGALPFGDLRGLQLYGTPKRAQAFLDLTARLGAGQHAAFIAGTVAREVGIDRLGQFDLADVIRQDLAKARQVVADAPLRPPKATGACCSCGATLPPQDLSLGGRPALYCPGRSCAPSRRPDGGADR